MVYRKVSTEGSGTAKVGTDEQKLDMRHGKPDEVTLHTDVQTQEAKRLPCRSSSDRPKEKALTGGCPDEAKLVGRSAEVIVVAERSRNRHTDDSQSSEGPNIKMFQIKQGFATSDSPVISGTGQDKKLND